MKEMENIDCLKYGSDDEISCSINVILETEKFSMLTAIAVIRNLCIENDGADINMVSSIISGFQDYLADGEEVILLLKKLCRLNMLSSREYTYEDGDEAITLHVKRKTIGEYAVSYLTGLGPKMEEFLEGLISINVDEARIRAKEMIKGAH